MKENSKKTTENNLTDDELLEEELQEEIAEEDEKELIGETNPSKPSDLERALAYAEDCKRKWYSVAAEYDNYRKRNTAAVSKAYADGVAEAVLKLLPVADNFGYALDSASDEKTRAGIDKIIKSFNTILASFGIEEIQITPGDGFDESVAEAIMNFQCEEGEQPNCVKQVLKKGYRSKDKVIRFAQVTVTV